MRRLGTLCMHTVTKETLTRYTLTNTLNQKNSLNWTNNLVAMFYLSEQSRNCQEKNSSDNSEIVRIILKLNILAIWKIEIQTVGHFQKTYDAVVYECELWGSRDTVEWKSESVTDGRTDLLTVVGSRDAYVSHQYVAILNCNDWLTGDQC